MQVKQISDNEIYLLIKYIKSVLWRAAKRLSYIEDARCLKVNVDVPKSHTHTHTHTNPAGLFCKGDQLVAEAIPYPTYNKHKGRTSMTSAGNEPPMPATELSHTTP